MKKTGIVRKLDDLGRITLPIELRRILHLAERDSIEISTDDDKIILQKYEPVDIFTGEKEDLIDTMVKRFLKNLLWKWRKLQTFKLNRGNPT